MECDFWIYRGQAPTLYPLCASPGTGTSPREPSDQWSASCQAVEEGVSGFTGVPDPDTRHNNGRLSPDWPRGSLSSLSRLPVIRRAPALGTRPGSLLSVRDRRDVPGRCAIRPAAARLGETTKLGHGGQLRGLREETPSLAGGGESLEFCSLTGAAGPSRSWARDGSGPPRGTRV